MASMAQAQNVEFVADWHPGDVFKYDVTKIVQKGLVVDTLHYSMVMTVADSTDEGYKIKMVYNGLYDNPILDSLMGGKLSPKDYETLQTVYYSTTDVGEVIGIDSADILIQSILKYSQALLLATGNDDDEVMSILKSLYTKEYILSGVYTEIPMLHNALGYVWPLNKPVKGKTKVENNLSGGYIDAMTCQTIEEFDPESQFCRLRITTKFNNKQLQKLVAKFMSSLGLSSKEMKEYRLSMVDEGVYEYIANPGIPVHVDCTRGKMISSKTESSGQMERFVITLVEPEIER